MASEYTDITIGRGQNSTFIIGVASISRHHATLRKIDADKYLLIDKSSTGTYVKTTEGFKAISEMQVSPKTIVRFGEVELSIRAILAAIENQAHKQSQNNNSVKNTQFDSVEQSAFPFPSVSEFNNHKDNFEVPYEDDFGFDAPSIPDSVQRVDHGSSLRRLPMLSRFILSSYNVLIEVLMWLVLVVGTLLGGTVGYYTNEFLGQGANFTTVLIGSLIGLISAFLFDVIVFGLLTMVSDIRKSVANLDTKSL